MRFCEPIDPTYHSKLLVSGRSPRLLYSVHAFRAIPTPDLAYNGLQGRYCLTELPQRRSEDLKRRCGILSPLRLGEDCLKNAHSRRSPVSLSAGTQKARLGFQG